MGNKPGKNRDERLSVEEYDYVCQTFKHLANRSPTKTMDKETFLHYFPLHGMLGERLFAVFDRKKNGTIDIEEFTIGVALISHGTTEEKCRFMYDMFNMAEDDGVSKAELRTMLNTVFHSAIDVTNALDGNTIDGSQEISQKLIKRSQSDGNFSQNSATVSFNSGSEMFNRNMDIDVSETVNDLVELAFDRCDVSQTGKLCYPEFVSWLEKNPAIFECITNNECFNKHDPKNTVSSQTSKKGYLDQHRKGILRTRKRRYYVVKGQFLYYYNNEQELTTPRGSIFLGGAMVNFIEKKKNETTASPQLERLSSTPETEGLPIPERTSNGGSSSLSPSNSAINAASGNSAAKYGFELFFHKKSQCFYADNIQEAIEWCAALRKHTLMRDIFEVYDIQNYSRELGKGGFATVYLAKHKETDLDVAVKVLNKKPLDEPEWDGMLAEIAILKLVFHPNIITMLEIYDVRDVVYIVTELCTGGEILKLFEEGAITEKRSFYLIEQLVTGISYLHRLGIVHRDLKPSNILLSSKDPETQLVKIVDFGFSAFVRDQDSLTLPVGTLKYYAPEIISEGGYNKPADLWTVGIILYCLVCGKFPFKAKDERELINKLSKAQFDRFGDHFKTLPADLQEVINHLLRVNASARPTAEETLVLDWFTRWKALQSDVTISELIEESEKAKI